MGEAEGLLVVSHWPTLPFYSKILKTKNRAPMIIPANVTNSVHPNNKKLKLTVTEKKDLMIKGNS